MTFCLQFGDVKTGGHREREREREGDEGGREREMLRWIDRQMQKRAELGITVQRFFPSPILPSRDDDGGRRCGT